MPDEKPWEYLDNRTRDRFNPYGVIGYRFKDYEKKIHLTFEVEYDYDADSWIILRWRVISSMRLSDVESASLQLKFAMEVRRIQFLYNDICNLCIEDYKNILRDRKWDV